MSNAPGAQQNPIYCMLAGGLQVSFDGGVTWAAAVSLAEIPLATPSANGLMSAAQFKQLNDGTMSSYSTALTDCTAAVDNIALVDMPLRTGFLFISRIYTLVIHDGTGTATGNMAWSMGNDASHQNVIGPITTTTTTINTLIGTAPYPSIGNGGGTGAFADAGTAIVAKITTAPTGVTALHCYFTVQGIWVPA